MSASNMFAALKEVNSEVDVPVISSKKSQKVYKKETKKVSKTKEVDTLRDDMTAFENDNPVGVILYHYKGKDQFLIFNFKFSHMFYIELKARGIKKLTVPIMEKIINEKTKKPNDFTIWFSYFEKETLEKLTEQEYFTAPSEFESTFNLVRGGPITNLKYSNAILFDGRFLTNKESFLYLSNGKRVHFGSAYDNYRVNKNYDRLVRLEMQYERSLKFFDLDEVYNARDEIFRLTDEPKDRDFADEAERFITKYVHIHHSDEQIELRRLLQFKNWADDLKIECERAIQYRDDLLNLLKKVRKHADRVEKASELVDEKVYPSL